jgi:hypothetical protein
MTEEQRSDAQQIRGFTTEGKPVGALGGWCFPRKARIGPAETGSRGCL